MNLSNLVPILFKQRIGLFSSTPPLTNFNTFKFWLKSIFYEEDKLRLLQRIYQLKLKCISPNIWSLQTHLLLECYHDLQPGWLSHTSYLSRIKQSSHNLSHQLIKGTLKLLWWTNCKFCHGYDCCNVCNDCKCWIAVNVGLAVKTARNVLVELL